MASSLELESQQIKKINDRQGSGHACLFNLIVYTEQPRQTEYFKEVVQLITQLFSCRVVFIQGHPQSKEEALSLKIVQEDQIFIEASGKEINRVYFLLLTLFVPDLPIYLLWGQDSTAGSILPHLRPFATRLIFDSESTQNMGRFCEDILTIIHSTSLDVIDLNWVRTRGWRNILAHVFDSPERFKQLQTAHNIKIFYQDAPNNASFHPASRALYLQAWLASCLNGNLKTYEEKDRALTLQYETEGKKQEIHLLPHLEEHFAPEEILALEILGENEYTCEIKRTSMDQVKVKAYNQFQCELPLTLLMPTLRSGRSFIQEVFYQKMSAHYLPTMELIHLTCEMQKK